MDKGNALFFALLMLGLVFLLIRYYSGRSLDNAPVKILGRLNQQNLSIAAICMKVLSSFSQHSYAKQLTDDSSLTALFQNAKEINQNFKRIRGCLIQLLPVHPGYGQQDQVIGDATYHFTATKIAIEVMDKSIVEIAQTYTKSDGQSLSFLKLCGLLREHLKEAREIVDNSILELQQLQAVLSQVESSVTNKAAI